MFKEVIVRMSQARAIQIYAVCFQNLIQLSETVIFELSSHPHSHHIVYEENTDNNCCVLGFLDFSCGPQQKACMQRVGPVSTNIYRSEICLAGFIFLFKTKMQGWMWLLRNILFWVILLSSSASQKHSIQDCQL